MKQPSNRHVKVRIIMTTNQTISNTNNSRENNNSILRKILNLISQLLKYLGNHIIILLITIIAGIIIGLVVPEVININNPQGEFIPGILPTLVEFPTETPTFTPSNTAIITNTPVPTATSTLTFTPSATSTSSPTATATSTITPSPTITATSTSTPVPTSTPPVQAIVASDNAPLHFGPGLTYPPAGNLSRDTRITLFARSTDNTWFRTQHNDHIVWICIRDIYFQSAGAYLQLPVDEQPVGQESCLVSPTSTIPPTATITPTQRPIVVISTNVVSDPTLIPPLNTQIPANTAVPSATMHPAPIAFFNCYYYRNASNNAIAHVNGVSQDYIVTWQWNAIDYEDNNPRPYNPIFRAPVHLDELNIRNVQFNPRGIGSANYNGIISLTVTDQYGRSSTYTVAIQEENDSQLPIDDTCNFTGNEN